MLDPDAPGGTFTRWLVYGMPPGISSLAAVPAGAAEGVNDFGRRGYGGPCPPRGPAHHYHFVVFALDTRLGLAAGATRSALESRIKAHHGGRPRAGLIKLGRYPLLVAEKAGTRNSRTPSVQVGE